MAKNWRSKDGRPSDVGGVGVSATLDRSDAVETFSTSVIPSSAASNDALRHMDSSSLIAVKLLAPLDRMFGLFHRRTKRARHCCVGDTARDGGVGGCGVSLADAATADGVVSTPGRATVDTCGATCGRGPVGGCGPVADRMGGSVTAPPDGFVASRHTWRHTCTLRHAAPSLQCACTQC
jgi:hypothetical protein